ncbi:hypothetical protein ANCCEY_10949 [Ancylostoma ceylanicum]|uniref:Uncharacterized protein n=1 Tax=Ancylostoma ceylanicum TaxID=53326 RepID=A0A0D6LD00_9BILA|nr:hypothetical protein ANCCEY_10949 [Ancylostoma ceylanicum]
MVASFGIPYDAKADPLQEMKAFKAAMADAKANPDWRTARQIERHRWNPYSFEGGVSPSDQNKEGSSTSSLVATEKPLMSAHPAPSVVFSLGNACFINLYNMTRASENVTVAPEILAAYIAEILLPLDYGVVPNAKFVFLIYNEA